MRDHTPKLSYCVFLVLQYICFLRDCTPKLSYCVSQENTMLMLMRRVSQTWTFSDFLMFDHPLGVASHPLVSRCQTTASLHSEQSRYDCSNFPTMPLDPTLCRAYALCRAGALKIALFTSHVSPRKAVFLERNTTNAGATLGAEQKPFYTKVDF